MRKNILTVIILALLLAAFNPGLAQAQPKVILDGSLLVFDVPPIIEDGRTLVPLRTIFEALGATVEWDNDTQTVSAVKAGNEVKLVIGGQAYKNGSPVSLDVPARIISGRTLAPLRFVSEAMGCAVEWDNDTQTVNITNVPAKVRPVKLSLNPDNELYLYVEAPGADRIYYSFTDTEFATIPATYITPGEAIILSGNTITLAAQNANGLGARATYDLTPYLEPALANIQSILKAKTTIVQYFDGQLDLPQTFAAMAQLQGSIEPLKNTGNAVDQKIAAYAQAVYDTAAVLIDDRITVNFNAWNAATANLNAYLESDEYKAHTTDIMINPQ
jgi:hypothetical protein